MENEMKPKCSGNCKNCLALQRQFCASQLAYNSMMVVFQLTQKVDMLEAGIKELNEKLNATQSIEADIFNPIEESSDEDESQGGDGEEE